LQYQFNLIVIKLHRRLEAGIYTGKSGFATK